MNDLSGNFNFLDWANHNAPEFAEHALLDHHLANDVF
jgi:hypothetical protein